MKNNKKKKFRLKKWAQTVYATLAAASLCFLVGVSAMEFSFTSIALIALNLLVLILAAGMLVNYGREED